SNRRPGRAAPCRLQGEARQTETPARQAQTLSSSKAAASVHPALRAFRSKSFRIFYAGQGLSLLGNWMQTVAMSWLVYRVTGSALLLGVTAGAQQLPILVLSPVAGVWADRVNRRRLLMLIQSLAFVQALALALLTFADVVRVPQLIGLAPSRRLLT